MMKVHVLDTPVFDLGPDMEILTGNVLELSVPNDYVTYEWSTGENSPNISFESSEAGEYRISVEVTNEDGCVGSDDLVIIVLDPLSLNHTIKWNVYPNPVHSTFSIEGSQNIEQVSLINMSAKKIKSWTSSISYHIDDIPPGVYLLLINEKRVMKMLIE